MIRTADIDLNQLDGKPLSTILYTSLLEGEVKGVRIDLVSAAGPVEITERPGPENYEVLLSLQGKGTLSIGEQEIIFESVAVARIPHTAPYAVKVPQGSHFHYMRIRKRLDAADLAEIAGNPDSYDDLYLKAMADCPVYTEDIKSEKTLNRMILPEGYVPRFCMGSVETTGPDEVGEHDHPMLDQLFLGLDDCRCTCFAGNSRALLTGNRLLHIPLGSKHAVRVDQNDRLSYIWFDFFLTLEGQQYMQEQHHMDDT